MEYNKGFASLILVAIIVGVLVVGGGAYYLNKGSNNTNKEVITKENNISKQTSNTNLPQEVNLAKQNIEVEKTVVEPTKNNTSIQGDNDNLTTSNIDCGSDLNCFIKAANNCQKSKVNIIKLNQESPFANATTNTTTRYEISGKDGNNCIARAKIANFSFKYDEEEVTSFLKGGKTKIDIENMEKEYSAEGEGMGQICRLSLGKKMGDTLNNDIINSTSNKISFSTSNDDTKYDSGLSCQQFTQLSDNPNCKLSMGSLSGIGVKIGASQNASVFGFNGKENQISWISQNKNIANIVKPIGLTTVIKGMEIGSTYVISTDNSVGPDCFVKLQVNVDQSE